MKKILLFTLLSAFSINAQTATDYVTGFNTPTGIAFDASGNLFVADFGNYKVAKVTPGLTKTDFVTLNSTPQQIAFDASGNLWSAGSGITQRIEKITPAGVITNYNTTGAPYGIAIDAAGNVFYSEENSGNIRKISISGAVTIFVTGLTQPNGLAFDKAGNLIVADIGDNVIKKITPTGVITTIVTSLMGPTNVAFAPNGDLYISCGAANRIFRLPAGGVNGDQTQFYRFGFSERPAQIAIYNGNLYVSTGSSTKKVIKIVDPSLGLGDIKKSTNDGIAVYPNPATNFLNIETNNVTIETIELYDITGRVIKSYKSSDVTDNKIALPGLTSGNYILKVNNTSKKIIIK